MDRVHSLTQPQMDESVPAAIFQILTTGTAYPFSDVFTRACHWPNLVFTRFGGEPSSSRLGSQDVDWL